MFSTAPMDRLGFLGYTDDADVDALINQLSDENLLKLKVIPRSTATQGFEYPTFTDGWLDDDATEALDTQLTSRFSSLKRPITPAKKKGKDSPKVGKKGSNPDGGLGGKKTTNGDSQPVFGKDLSRSESRERREYDVRARKYDEEGEDSRRLSSTSFSRISSSRRREDGSSSRRHQIKRESSRNLSSRTEFFSFRSTSWDDPAAAAGGDEEEDPDSIDALLNERFKALKAPSHPNHGPRDNLIQSSGQLSAANYDNYGSSASIPSSPSANLLGRSQSRSSPRLMTSSVVASCHCSAPSAFKLMRQVGSKSFPSRQQSSKAGSLPPLAPAPRSSTTAMKKSQREYKVEGFGNSKPGTKDSEKNVKEKNGRSNGGNNNISSTATNNPSTVKEMKRLLSSVADRVGLERSRVSSALDDEFLGEDLNVWSVEDGDQEFARASTEEDKVNREAERVVEWAKDAARLDDGESDVDGDIGELELDEAVDAQESIQRNASKKGNPKKKGIKVAPKKKKWGLF